MNARQEDRLERIERLLAGIADLLHDSVQMQANPPFRQEVSRRCSGPSGLNDLVVASNEKSAELERDRREAEHANGWAPDSELSYRDQFRRLEAQVREYEREVDARLGDPDDPHPSGRLPWNRQANERVRPIERSSEDPIRAKRRADEKAQYDETVRDRRRERRAEDLP